MSEILTFVSHVMDFVENDPGNLSSDFRASVKHTSQDLRSHDKTRGRRINRNITGHQADVLELFEEFSIFLITQRLYWCRIDDTLFVSQRHSYGVLGDYGFTG